MVSPFATVHTFLTHLKMVQKALISYGQCLLIIQFRYFFAVFDYAGKEDLRKSFQNKIKNWGSPKL